MSQHSEIIGYEEYLTGLGLDAGTRYNYGRKLSLAAEVAAAHGWDLTRVSPSEMAAIADAFPRSSSSRGILRAALGHYWAMCGVEGPAEAIRIPRPPPWRYRGLEDDQAEKLEEAAGGWWPEGGAVLLGLYLALRRAEMAALRWEDFGEGMEWVTIMGKGGRTRYLPVHGVLRDELAPRAAEGYLFPGHGREFVHTGTVRSWIDKVAHRALGETVAPHALRHTCLTRLNDETGDLRVVQAFAGHADPAQTSHYTRASETRMAEAVASLRYGQKSREDARDSSPMRTYNSMGKRRGIIWDEAPITRGEPSEDGQPPVFETLRQLAPALRATTYTEADDETHRLWQEDRARAGPRSQALCDELYHYYASEGHLVVCIPVHDDRPGHSWMVFCTCGAMTPEPPITVLADWREAKWWGIEHRTTHGLEVQEWTPAREVSELRVGQAREWGLVS